MVPAQCVPWDCLSMAQLLSFDLHSFTLPLVESIVGIARPPKSECEVRIP